MNSSQLATLNDIIYIATGIYDDLMNMHEGIGGKYDSADIAMAKEIIDTNSVFDINDLKLFKYIVSTIENISIDKSVIDIINKDDSWSSLMADMAPPGLIRWYPSPFHERYPRIKQYIEPMINISTAVKRRNRIQLYVPFTDDEIRELRYQFVMHSCPSDYYVLKNGAGFVKRVIENKPVRVSLPSEQSYHSDMLTLTMESVLFKHKFEKMNGVTLHPHPLHPLLSLLSLHFTINRVLNMLEYAMLMNDVETVRYLIKNTNMRCNAYIMHALAKAECVKTHQIISEENMQRIMNILTDKMMNGAVHKTGADKIPRIGYKHIICAIVVIFAVVAMHIT